MLRWGAAMATALYGPDGFFVRPGAGPAGHFRTAATASPLFAQALLELVQRVDRALGQPDPYDLVDLGAGRGELLTALHRAAPERLAARLRLTAVELAPAPAELHPAIHWSREPPAPATGLLLATEWLDNVPVDVAEVDDHGVVRYVLVDPATGEEAPGEPVSGADAAWLTRWWPLTTPGTRAEIGRPRDHAWTAAVGTLDRGLAVAVDYGHDTPARPPLGTLTGFRAGRQVRPVPDGSRDLTAHVAVDAVAVAPRLPGAVLLPQARALAALGVDAARPPLSEAHRDPTGYLRRLTAAAAAAELTDPAGLGGHYWLLQPVGLPEPADVAGWLA